MSKNKKLVGFVLAGIKTEQFAVLPENYNEDEDIEVEAGFELKANAEEKMVGSFATFTFEQQQRAFIKISVSCHFAIEPASWEEYLNKEKTSIKFPRDFAIHLAMVTVGTTRGVLFAKTEGTNFSQFILPVVNVQKMIEDDVEFILEDV
jgi:hypothetical protein